MSTDRAWDTVALVDHHCHGVVAGELDRPAFEQLLTESDQPAPALTGGSFFDSPLGLAVRRWCAPVLDLEPHADPDRYLERRAALGAEANRRLLRAAGVARLLLDSGYQPTAVLGVTAMGELAGAAAYELVRLEAVAEALVAEQPDLGAAEFAERYAARLRAAVADAAPAAVGLKSIVAYRLGFDFDPEPPSREDVTVAAGRWLRQVQGGARSRLEDPVLLRHVLWAGVELARERALPLQFHTGFGDPDLLLHKADPLLLTGLIRRLRPLGVQVVLLHCYPYQRHAGYLAAVYPNVWFDVGLALNYTGAQAGVVLGEALELAPFAKQLYSSDAYGLAELHYLGALRFRRALGQVLGRWVAEGECRAADADRIAALLGAGNAERLYHLDGRR